MATEKIIKFKIKVDSPSAAADLVAARSGLSKAKVKDAMNKGAFWIRRGSKLRRSRQAAAILKQGDCIEFYYDPALLAIKPPEPYLVADIQHYSVWFKPAGLMAQGTMYGDHCSLLRQAELHFGSKRQVYLLHRLDREASGLMLVGHTKEAASKLSLLFQQNMIEKLYRVEVLGDIRGHAEKSRIDMLIDGKTAVTDYEFISYDSCANSSLLDVRIATGRLHQIRRHFDMLGYPVIGDPKYGQGNKNREGMKLSAVGLKFICPFTKKEACFRI